MAAFKEQITTAYAFMEYINLFGHRDVQPYSGKERQTKMLSGAGRGFGAGGRKMAGRRRPA
ncbi:hypothetical protein ACL2XP_23805 [Sodalis sp. RH21]|uniref:hypothetical protein n=1 Tax=unclassified Sodalis (in: enterobacteria) TaxID=2636512 RepID=UPI0039B621E6